MTRPVGLRLAALLSAATLLATGCADDGSDAPAGAGLCAAPEEPTVQDGGHLIGDQEPPVPYSSTPASSGWHTAGPPPTGVHTEPLTDPQIVSVLHVGGVVAAYDPATATEEDLAVLQEFVGGPTGLTITPYEDGLEATMALLAWGVIQRCEDVEPEVVEAFVSEHAGTLMGH